VTRQSPNAASGSISALLDWRSRNLINEPSGSFKFCRFGFVVLFKTDILDLATVDTAVKLETVGSRSVLSISTRCQVGRLILLVIQPYVLKYNAHLGRDVLHLTYTFTSVNLIFCLSRIFLKFRSCRGPLFQRSLGRKCIDI